MNAIVFSLAGICVAVILAFAGMRIAGVPLADEVTIIGQISALIGPIIIALLAWFKANQVDAKTEDNKQAVGVVARVAIDGYSGPPAAKAEAVKSLNGTLPAPGSADAKRPNAQ